MSKKRGQLKIKIVEICENFKPRISYLKLINHAAGAHGLGFEAVAE